MASVVTATTNLRRRTSGGSWASLGFLNYRNGGNTWTGFNGVKIKNSDGSWSWMWSTPTVSVPGGSGDAASGASSSGSASVTLRASPAGTNSGDLSYQWAWVDGDGAISWSGATNAQNVTLTRAFTGVANGTTSGSVTGRVTCTITDNQTGASYVSDPVSLGNMSWQNTIPAYSPVTANGPTLETGSNTITVPGNCSASASSTASPGGGNGSYSYSWLRVSGSEGLSPSGGTTSQTLTLGITDAMTDAGSATFDESWQCTVSDGVSSASFITEFKLTCNCTYGPPSVSADDADSTLFGFGFVNGTASASTTTTVSGHGSGSYSYAWSRLTTSEGISINNAALQNPTWSCTVNQGGVGVDSHQETWQVVVTDTVTGLTASTTINVQLNGEVDND